MAKARVDWEFRKGADVGRSVVERVIRVSTTASVSAEGAKAIAGDAAVAAARAESAANSALDRLQEYSDDNLINPTEKKALKKEMDVILSEKDKIVVQASGFNIQSNSYVEAFTSLKNYIGENLDNLTSTWDLGSNGGSTIRGKFKAYYDQRTDLLNAISSKAKEAGDLAARAAADANEKAQTAISAAETAQASAVGANAVIAEISSEDKVTAGEKQSLKREYDVIVSEFPKNAAQADTFGVSKIGYTGAYNDLIAYVGVNLNDLSTTWNLGAGGGATFRAKFKCYYDQRTDLLNNVSLKAKQLADAASQSAASIQAGALMKGSATQQVVVSPVRFVGQVQIDGDVIQNGAAYETHAQHVYTADDFITLRDGAISSLADGSYTGFRSKRVFGDGSDGYLVFGADGMARVGKQASLQMLATREDSPLDGGVAVWSVANKRFNTVSQVQDSARLGGVPAAEFGRRWYDGWVSVPGYDANTIGASKSGFSYANNAPYNGPIVRFDAGGYDLELSSSYHSNDIAFRTRNGDTATWNSWRSLWHNGNVPSPVSDYFFHAGYDWNTVDFVGSSKAFIARVESGALNPPIAGVYNWSLYQQGNKIRGSQLAISAYGGGNNMFFRSSNPSAEWNSWAKVWHSDNDGGGSGLDADLLDGLHASDFARLYYDDGAAGGEAGIQGGGRAAGLVRLHVPGVEYAGMLHMYAYDGGWQQLKIRGYAGTESIRFRTSDQNTWRDIWHAGNSNISTANWTAKDVMANGLLKSYTSTGNIEIGSLNASWVHFYTSLPVFFSNPVRAVNSIGVYSYDNIITNDGLLISNGHARIAGVVKSLNQNGSGFTASGWQIGDYSNLYNLDVRAKLQVYEFVQNKINITNGNMIVSDNASIETKVDYWGDGNTIRLFLKGTCNPFQNGDVVRCQNNGKSYILTVGWNSNLEGASTPFIDVNCSAIGGNTIPSATDILVRWNSSDPSRKGLIYLNSSDTNNPNFQVLYDGVVKGCFGNCAGLNWQGSVLPANSFGVWIANGWFSGAVNAISGNIGQLILNGGELQSPISGNRYNFFNKWHIGTYDNVTGFVNRISADGSGMLARGAITWDSAGNIAANSGRIATWIIEGNNLRSNSDRIVLNGDISSIWVTKPTGGHVMFGQTFINGAWTGKYGFSATNASHQELVRIDDEVTRLSGWTITPYELNGYTSAGNGVILHSSQGMGTITNWGSTWTNQLRIDGSGMLARGNIAWDAAGNVNFSDSVRLNWTNLDYATGECLYPDMYFANGFNGTGTYNNLGNGNVVCTIIDKTSDCPSPSGKMMRITFNGSAVPGYGGFYFATPSYPSAKYVVRIIAKIPTGSTINFASNAIGDAAKGARWLTSQNGSGKFEEYRCLVECGSSGSFHSTNFFYLEGNQPSWGFTMDVAMATVYDIIKPNKQLTRIDANGIYTGTLTAQQILSTNAVFGSANIADASITSAKIASLDVSKLTGDVISGKTFINRSAENTDLLSIAKGSIYTYNGGKVASQYNMGELKFFDTYGVPSVFVRNSAVSLDQLRNVSSVSTPAVGTIGAGGTACSSSFTLSQQGTYNGSTPAVASTSVSYDWVDNGRDLGDYPNQKRCYAYTIAHIKLQRWDGSTWVDMGVVGSGSISASSNSLSCSAYNVATTFSVSFTVTITGTYRFAYSVMAESSATAYDSYNNVEFDVVKASQTAEVSFSNSLNISLTSNGTFIGTSGIVVYDKDQYSNERYCSVDKVATYFFDLKGRTRVTHGAYSVEVGDYWGVEIKHNGATCLKIYNGAIYLYNIPSATNSGLVRKLYIDDSGKMWKNQNCEW